MEKIETFEDLLEMAPGTVVFEIDNGHISRKIFLGKYDHEYGTEYSPNWVAVLVPLHDYEKMDWHSFQTTKLYTAITEEGAREVAIGQMEAIKMAFEDRWNRDLEKLKLTDLSKIVSV